MIPGELWYADGDLELNAGRPRKEIVVINEGDRPVQVGSHYHFADVNDALSFFDRSPAKVERSDVEGFRLDIPAGKSLRFEPQASAQVTLVALGGPKTVPGLRPRGEHRG